jgi:hypothetical protein
MKESDRRIRELERAASASKRFQARTPLRDFTGHRSPSPSPYITLRIQGGNELIASPPGPVYGIKRFAGEALFDPTDKTGNVQATATCTILSGAVNTVTQVINGEGYVAPPPVVSVGAPPGGGTQAVITATIAPSFVKFVYLTNVGSAYDEGVTVAFSAPGGGTTATGVAVIRDGEVVGIEITNQGNGYAIAPSVTITPIAGGSGAAATAVLAIGSITLAITTPGSGYLAAPVVFITEPSTPIPASETYPDGIGIAQVVSGPLYTPSLPAPAINSQVIVVHDDRSLVAYGLMGEGPSVPFSRPPDSVATWYETLLKIDGADVDADGVIPAWVPMFGGL